MYHRDKALAYAKEWVYKRNPKYYDFERIGGDCTNFNSQCIYAGCGVMNYKRDLGWYYNSPSDRSPAWSGVQYLYNFLVNNKGRGPYGQEQPLSNAQPGDVIQLNFHGQTYGHSLLVIRTDPNPNNILIATHTYDAYNRPLGTYMYHSCRLIHILGARS